VKPGFDPGSWSFRRRSAAAHHVSSRSAVFPCRHLATDLLGFWRSGKTPATGEPAAPISQDLRIPTLLWQVLWLLQVSAPSILTGVFGPGMWIHRIPTGTQWPHRGGATVLGARGFQPLQFPGGIVGPPQLRRGFVGMIRRHFPHHHPSTGAAVQRPCGWATSKRCLASAIAAVFFCRLHRGLNELVWLSGHSCGVLFGPTRYQWDQGLLQRQKSTVVWPTALENGSAKEECLCRDS